jgi:hypothetical protein
VTVVPHDFSRGRKSAPVFARVDERVPREHSKATVKYLGDKPRGVTV